MSVFGDIIDEVETLANFYRSALRSVCDLSLDPDMVRIAEQALTERVHKCWDCGDHYIESVGCRSPYCLTKETPDDEA